MNPTITAAAKLVIIAVAVLTGLWLLIVAALVAFFDVGVQDAVLLGIMLDGPVMGLLALLANTRPSESMLAAVAAQAPGPSRSEGPGALPDPSGVRVRRADGGWVRGDLVNVWLAVVVIVIIAVAIAVF